MTEIGIINRGLTIIVRTTAPSIYKLVCTASNRARGNSSSTVPRSFEKRFSIRPDGLILKKRIVVDIMLVNIQS